MSAFSPKTTDWWTARWSSRPSTYGTELALSPATTKSSMGEVYAVKPPRLAGHTPPPAASGYASAQTHLNTQAWARNAPLWCQSPPSQEEAHEASARAGRHIGATGRIRSGLGHLPVRAGRSNRGETLLAGYRVVRRLASTSRADVYLGHSSHAGDAPVALKIFRPDADPESIEREVRTLCDSRPGRFVHLIDVATLPDARVCLVLERLNPQSLGRLLQDRKTLAPGEVVSILAPIVTTLSYLHEHGLAHGALDSGNVLLHPSGRPVVAGLGSLHELPASPSAKISLLREDYDRLAALLDDVLGHLDSACDAAATQGATRLMLTSGPPPGAARSAQPWANWNAASSSGTSPRHSRSTSPGRL